MRSKEFISKTSCGEYRPDIGYIILLFFGKSIGKFAHTGLFAVLTCILLHKSTKFLAKILLYKFFLPKNKARRRPKQQHREANIYLSTAFIQHIPKHHQHIIIAEGFEHGNHLWDKSVVFLAIGIHRKLLKLFGGLLAF